MNEPDIDPMPDKATAAKAEIGEFLQALSSDDYRNTFFAVGVLRCKRRLSNGYTVTFRVEAPGQRSRQPK